jgi:hypothetical protein
MPNSLRQLTLALVWKVYNFAQDLGGLLAFVTAA